MLRLLVRQREAERRTWDLRFGQLAALQLGIASGGKAKAEPEDFVFSAPKRRRRKDPTTRQLVRKLERFGLFPPLETVKEPRNGRTGR